MRRRDGHLYHFLVGSGLLGLGAAVLLSLGGQKTPAEPADTQAHFLTVGARKPDALGGKAFATRLQKLSPAAREQAIQAEVASGNIPNFLRLLVPVSYQATAGDGRDYTVTIFVMPDYLAVGSDDDYLRMPVNLPTAFAIADGLGLHLPTKKIVDMVYENSRCHITPTPMPAGRQMSSTQYYVQHHRKIEQQKGRQAGAPAHPGTLLAGHKKDLVVTGRLLDKRDDRVAIYGWHRPSGKAIQPLSTVHEAAYADYSHGLRLVSPLLLINDEVMNYEVVLSDPRWAPLVSDEGPIKLNAILARFRPGVS